MTGPVLVTGASGGLGGAVLEALGRRGSTVRCLVHERPVEGVADPVRGDLADPASLRRAVNGVTAVMHLAALTHARRPGSYMEVNLRGTDRLLSAAGAAGIRRFVLAGTRAVSPEGGAYSRSKALAERAVENGVPEPVVVRLPELYGGAGAEGVNGIVARARQGRAIPVVGSGDHELRPMHIEDAASALAGALYADPGTYTVGGPPITVRGFAERCVAAAGTTSPIRSVPEPAVAALCRLARWLPVPVFPDQLARLRAPKPGPTAGAEEILGFTVRSLDDGLRDVLREP